MTGDKKFAIIITLFAIAGVSLAVAMLTMVLLDEQVHSGHSGHSASGKGGGGLPRDSLLLFEK
jgi:hypothetical protein